MAETVLAIWHLASDAWGYLISSLGTTTQAVWAAIFVFILSMLVTFWRMHWDLAAMKFHFARNIRDGLVISAVVWVAMFGWSIFKVYIPSLPTVASTFAPTPPASASVGKSRAAFVRALQSDGANSVPVCSGAISVASQITSRLYAMTPRIADGKQNLEFQYQELFYDWILSIHSALKGSAVTIKDNRIISERMRVTPEDSAEIGPDRGHWVSGFEEPRDPDYHTRDISIGRNADTVSIVLRRPFVFNRGENSGSAKEFIGRSIDSPSGCKSSITKFDDLEQSNRLLKQFSALAQWKYSGPDKPGPQIIMNPNEYRKPLPPGFVQATVEAYCANDDCSKLTVHQLEASAP